MGTGLVRKEAEHARRHGFQFLVQGSPENYDLLRLGAFEDDEQEVTGLPTWMPNHPRRHLVPKTTTLLPFANEHDLRAAFGECHDLAYKALAHDPASTFDLILLVVAAKILDERSENPTYRFSLLAGETPSDSSDRLAKLVTEAARWLDGSAASLGDVPKVPTALASRLLGAFQNFSLTLTAGVCRWHRHSRHGLRNDRWGNIPGGAGLLLHSSDDGGLHCAFPRYPNGPCARPSVWERRPPACDPENERGPERS